MNYKEWNVIPKGSRFTDGPFIVEKLHSSPPHGTGESWGVTLPYAEKPSMGARVIVQRIARHWRICIYEPGPALEGHERYETWEEGMHAAKELLTAQDAARRLAGGPTFGTITGRLSSAHPGLQNLPRSANAPITGADYSDLELRVLGAMKAQPVVIDEAFGFADGQVTKATRALETIGPVRTGASARREGQDGTLPPRTRPPAPARRPRSGRGQG